jgi:putative transposase
LLSPSATGESWKTSTLDVNAKQYVLRTVNDNWSSFYRACKAYWKDKSKFLGKPNMPKYLKNGRTAVLTFDKSRLRNKNTKTNTLTLPKSKWAIKIPDYIGIQRIRCIKVKSFYGKVKLTISYERGATCHKTDKGKWIGIDIGVDNTVAISTDNQTKKSWIVKGGCVKLINQFYNKRLSEMRSTLEGVNAKKTSKAIQKLNMKRNNRIEYEFHCISKTIVRTCIENGIGNVVVGHNVG